MGGNFRHGVSLNNWVKTLYSHTESYILNNAKMLEIPPIHTDRENHCYQVIGGLPISLSTLASLLELQSFRRNKRSTLHFSMEW